jgi:DNA-binding transcriptional LysR family regulator
MFSISKDIINLSNQEKMLNIGTSYVIGNYILPCYLNDIKKNLSVNINLVVEDSNTILSQLLNDEIDVALLEIVENNEEVIVKKWMEDEIVLFSNQKLPPKPTPEDLLFKANLDRINYPDCSSFNIINESSSITSILQQIKTAPKDETPYVSIVSKHVICQEQPHLLFSTRLPNTKMKKSLYFVCKKDKKHDVLINSIEKYLFQVVKPSYFSRHPEEN